ncbi:Zinc finger, C2H2 type family protein [Histomonas meleagridis]|uniref:zinc finger protein, C2H2 type family protein n=1 Tax=Histomonas meleagridis TaxID=135588 RepID=UPI00355A79D5|nr:Zinc finger, C2H2 type family protein [Histomonas meleagridis]KAH0797026.1 zinc finger protein, C2H2 type family protein [Histomonas meleagridis]
MNQVKSVNFFEKFTTNVYLIDSQNDNNIKLLKNFYNADLFAIYLDVRTISGTPTPAFIIVVTNLGTIVFSNFKANAPLGKSTHEFFSEISTKKCYCYGFFSYKRLLANNYGFKFNIPDIEIDTEYGQSFTNFKTQLSNAPYNDVIQHHKTLFSTPLNTPLSIYDVISIVFTGVELYKFLRISLSKPKPPPQVQNEPPKEKPSTTTLHSCPICRNITSNNVEAIILHLVKVHFKQANFDANASPTHPQNKFVCLHCNQILNRINEFILHVYHEHPQNLRSVFVRDGSSPSMNEFLQQAFQVETKQPEKAPAVDEDLQSEEDEEYTNLIVSTIRTRGIKNNAVATIGEIRPVMIQQNKQESNSENVGKSFWNKLDRLECTLQAKMKISDPTSGEFKCNICNKGCHTYIKLLEHCWNNHRNELDDD